MNSNPLLDFSGLPRFDAIDASHVGPAIGELIARARAAIEVAAAETSPATWDSVVEPLATPLDHLDRAWGAVAHLNAVKSTPELRNAYNGNLPAVTAFYTDLGQDLRLFARYRELAGTSAFAALERAKRRMVENEIRDFRLAGAELAPEAKARFKAISEELASLAAKFDDNLLDETNEWGHYVTDEKSLAGLPAPVVAEARAAAAAEGRAGWKLTLHMPCYRPVLQYADDRELRRLMHRAYATRASELGVDPERDNMPIIRRTLALRREAAELLGRRHYGDISLERKMADSAEEVLTFVRDLARRARPFALKDYAELEAFARDELGLNALEACDLAYASEKQKSRRYAFTAQEIREYFPEDHVLAGLFRVVETIYGISVREGRAETWHPDVRYFEISDRDGTRVGSFYLDLHARPGKQGGAWMDDAINRRRCGGQIQHPVAYLTCNLSAPVGGEPATFTHEEVLTIFHEFGHGLHQLLTRVDVPGVSGLQGVEWDAVELPSQFMENFAWQWEVVRDMTSHTRAGETHGAPLPRALFDRMVAAKNFQSGMGTIRQLELALFDMLLHTEYDPLGEASPQSVLDRVIAEIGVVPRPDYDRFMQSFGHVFAGGYAARNYSYKWAEVLSADAFSLFEEAGVLSPAAGARFRDEVLASGGSRDALESFVAFRGRPPQLDALLRHNGMIVPA